MGNREYEPGDCPVCTRDMIKGPSINKHHFLPQSRGGRETEWIHRVCHSKIHATFTNKELEEEYHNPNKVRQHPEIIKFIKWLAKKPPDYYGKSKRSSARRKRK